VFRTKCTSDNAIVCKLTNKMRFCDSPNGKRQRQAAFRMAKGAYTLYGLTWADTNIHTLAMTHRHTKHLHTDKWAQIALSVCRCYHSYILGCCLVFLVAVLAVVVIVISGTTVSATTIKAGIDKGKHLHLGCVTLDFRAL